MSSLTSVEDCTIWPTMPTMAWMIAPAIRATAAFCIGRIWSSLGSVWRTPATLWAAARRHIGAAADRGYALALIARAAQVGEHGEDAAVAVLALRDVELAQHMADVRLDRALAEEQPLGDPAVGQPLGHQSEDLPLALGELGERPVGARRRDEPPDDLRVERRAAAGNPLGRREELLHLEDAV